MAEGKIFQSLSGFYDIISDGKIYRTRARGNFRKKGITPLVGDNVEFESTTPKEGYLLKIFDRKNSLVRPPISNIDQAVVVTSAVQPDFSYNLLDRQLVAVEINKITPIIYFTKTDLLDDQQFDYFKEVKSVYENAGYKVILPSNQGDNNKSVEEIKDLFAHKETVFMGQTGAGKSTLLNKISPDLNLATGEISAALNRGKHTTRKVSFIEINNGLVADTPGFSSYEAFDIKPEELRDYFPEFRENANKCKFRGCVHINEPGCAIKSMLENDELSHERYHDYVQLYDILKNKKPIYNKKK
ncbi:MAG: ribosome small subunit-dependent GTPase A [Apilactobacillus sp.]|uniref:ribosome small subunit-dependent GTPase A n=1 Tax=Apilactobacillus TaxID=2767877 RepID=UPI0025D58620|nr:ribosome small subunit-dependent GTPase A [Apilactobacillus sp.]MCT6822351.1 ribosome small subunit-dependent GTPase A [Apilactobacillus sp.]MCT6857693.1 ribosome small subunit-dependent GTPase A [Apilactobacillus sp.]